MSCAILRNSDSMSLRCRPDTPFRHEPIKLRFVLGRAQSVEPTSGSQRTRIRISEQDS
jgi:hypothetical protein